MGLAKGGRRDCGRCSQQEVCTRATNTQSFAGFTQKSPRGTVVATTLTEILRTVMGALRLPSRCLDCPSGRESRYGLGRIGVQPES